jgi:hypothetical protein
MRSCGFRRTWLTGFRNPCGEAAADLSGPSDGNAEVLSEDTYGLV